MAETVPRCRDADLITAEANRRGVSKLVHFTPSINLLSIFRAQAVLSRVQLDRLAIEAPELHLDDYVETNDSMRLDNRRDHINLSIESPNIFLMRKFRARPHYFDDWCILILSVDCLAFAGTLYSVSNAASSAAKGYGIAGDYVSFERMFADQLTVGGIASLRVVTRCALRPCYPTDSQAEVLVHQRIPLAHIKRVCFESEQSAKSSLQALKLIGVMPECPFVCEPKLFSGERS